MSVTWLGLLIDFPLTRPHLWFPVSAVTLVIASALHFISKRREFSIEFLFSLALIYAGLNMQLDFAWLKLAYFPFVIIVSAFYGLKVVVPFSLLVPLIGLRAFFVKETLPAEAAFSFSFVLTAVLSTLIRRRLLE